MKQMIEYPLAVRVRRSALAIAPRTPGHIQGRRRSLRTVVPYAITQVALPPPSKSR